MTCRCGLEKYFFIRHYKVETRRETHFDPERDIVAAVHQSSVEPTSRWSLQNSKPMSPSTLLTFFLAFRRLPRLLTGSWNILPAWVEKDKHNRLSTVQPGSGTTGPGRFHGRSTNESHKRLELEGFGHSSGRTDLRVMTLDETCRSRALILVHSNCYSIGGHYWTSVSFSFTSLPPIS